MSRCLPEALLVVLLGVRCLGITNAQTLKIGIIDFYGLGQLSETQIREKLTFAIGDEISFSSERSASFVETERRLAGLPGVRSVSVNRVCCEAGGVIIYVGLESKDQPVVRFNPAPAGDARLSPDVLQAANAFETAFMAAVQRGDVAEDDSQGHAFVHDPAARAIQERFVVFAGRDLSQLRQVLHESADQEQRAIAAEIMAYAADKQSVVPDLVAATRDPSPDVRNNAVRALGVFTRMSPSSSRAAIRIPYEPFIELLSSPVWTDRNKASLAVMQLTDGRDPVLLAALKRAALTPLIEMARWKSEGHAMPGLTILGRIAGESDESVKVAWDRGERERVIQAAIGRR